MVIGIFLMINSVLPVMTYVSESGSTEYFGMFDFFTVKPYQISSELRTVIGTTLALNNAIYVIGLYLVLLFFSGVLLVAISLKKLGKLRAVAVPLIGLFLIVAHLTFCIFTGSRTYQAGFFIEGSGQFLGFTVLNFLALVALVIAMAGNNLRLVHPESKMARYVAGISALVFIVLIGFDTRYAFDKADFIASAWFNSDYSIFFISGAIVFATVLMAAGARAIVNMGNHGLVRKFAANAQHITIWTAIFYTLYLFLLTSLLIYIYEGFTLYFVSMSFLSLRTLLITISILLVFGMGLAYRLNVHYKWRHMIEVNKQ